MDALATTLLRRTGRLYAPPPDGEAPPDAELWVRALEADLAERGWLLSRDVRDRFMAFDLVSRSQWADWLLASADESVGADRVHTPLFRRFPDTPANPDQLFVERVLANWFQDSDVGCVLCGQSGTIQPVDPCGHLVCQRCFDPATFSACPICGRKAAGSGLQAPETRPPGPAIRLTVITLGDDLTGDAALARDDLVARASGLSERERDDLRLLIDATTQPGSLEWLPEVVPNRETSALISAWALRRAVLPEDLTSVVAQIQPRWHTATDVARTLWAYSDGNPSLVLPAPAQPGPDEKWRPSAEPRVDPPRPRVRALPRPLRTAALASLDAFGAAVAAEDLNRHPTIWKRVGERLHPFERVSAYPLAAVAFAALRSTRTHRDTALGGAMQTAATSHPKQLLIKEHPDGRISIRARTFAAAIQEALDSGDIRDALAMLRTRPGEFWRRVDHLARAAGDDPDIQSDLIAAAGETAPNVAPGVLSSAAAELRGREATVPVAAEVEARRLALAKEAAAAAPSTGASVRRRWFRRGGTSETVTQTTQRPRLRTRPPAPAPGTPRRVFFPRGNVARSWTEPERRGPLPPDLVAGLRENVDRELTRRAAALTKFDIAIIDRALADVPAPTRTSGSSAQLAGWTRGARLALPDLDVLRLFLHWVQPESARVDLDLSCAFYRSDWTHAGHCDYTTLRFADNAAIHSGDFTSAPAPLGATEFLDLRLPDLAAAGVRYAIPTIFSYNDIVFELLPDAFAGFSLPAAKDAQFDAGRVVQRFDLRGDSRMLVPMLIDVEDRLLLWIDVHVTSGGYGHRAGRHSSNLARLGADMWEHFASGSRPTLLDLAAWHAAGRAGELFIADFGEGRSVKVASQPNVSGLATAIREAAAGSCTSRLPELVGRTALVITADADLASVVLDDPQTADSVMAAPVGRAAPPWQTIRPEELLAGLVPIKAS